MLAIDVGLLWLYSMAVRHRCVEVLHRRIKPSRTKVHHDGQPGTTASIWLANQHSASSMHAPESSSTIPLLIKQNGNILLPIRSFLSTAGVKSPHSHPYAHPFSYIRKPCRPGAWTNARVPQTRNVSSTCTIDQPLHTQTTASCNHRCISSTTGRQQSR